MYINLTITAVADRDESCNLLTFTETHRYSIAMPPTAGQIREVLAAHKDKFLEMWPHRGVNQPRLVPMDVYVELVDGTDD